MATVLTIRDVPDDVRDTLSRDARERGQSLQAFLLSVLTRQANFSRNRQVLADIDRDLSSGGGAEADAPDPAVFTKQARARQDTDQSSPPRDTDAA